MTYISNLRQKHGLVNSRPLWAFVLVLVLFSIDDVIERLDKKLQFFTRPIRMAYRCLYPADAKLQRQEMVFFISATLALACMVTMLVVAGY